MSSTADLTTGDLVRAIEQDDAFDDECVTPRNLCHILGRKLGLCCLGDRTVRWVLPNGHVLCITLEAKR